jgi:hypothetical protein
METQVHKVQVQEKKEEGLKSNRRAIILYCSGSLVVTGIATFYCFKTQHTLEGWVMSAIMVGLVLLGGFLYRSYK